MLKVEIFNMCDWMEFSDENPEGGVIGSWNLCCRRREQGVSVSVGTNRTHCAAVVGAGASTSRRAAARLAPTLPQESEAVSLLIFDRWYNIASSFFNRDKYFKKIGNLNLFYNLAMKMNFLVTFATAQYCSFNQDLIDETTLQAIAIVISSGLLIWGSVLSSKLVTITILPWRGPP